MWNAWGELKGILGKAVAALPHVYHFHIDHNAPFLFYSYPKIDLVTVFDAILTSRQKREKLQ